MKKINLNIITAVAVCLSVTCFTGNSANAQNAQRGSSSSASNANKTHDMHSDRSMGMSKMDDQTFAQKAMAGNMAEIMMAKLALQKATSEKVKEFAQMMIDDHSQANDQLKALVSGVAMGNAPEQMGAMGHDMHNGANGSMGNTSAGTTDTGSVGNTGTSSMGAGNANRTTDNNNVDNRTEKTGSDSGLGVAASPAKGSGVGRTDYKGDAAPGMGSAAYDDPTMLSAEHRAAYDKLSKLTGAQFDRDYMQAQVEDHEKTIALFENESKNGQDARLKEFATTLLPTLRKHRQTATDISNSMRSGSASGSSGSNN